MNYNKFQEQIINEIKKLIAEDKEIKLNKVMKNNGIEQCGITILEKDSNIMPTFYLEHYYEKYKEGESVEKLASQIVRLHEENKVNEKLDVSFFQDFEQVKHQIVFKLINTKLNQKLLQDIPHKQFMDLSIVLYYLWDFKQFENATVLIRNEHLKMWQVDEEKLFSVAMNNTETILGSETIKMEEILLNMLRPKEEMLWLKNIDSKMYVLTNQYRLFGASTMLYDHVIRDFAICNGKNVYIIPSSVHELILIPDDGQIDCSVLNEMVKEVNETQLDRREILADHVYYYDYEDDVLAACMD